MSPDRTPISAVPNIAEYIRRRDNRLFRIMACFGVLILLILIVGGYVGYTTIQKVQDNQQNAAIAKVRADVAANQARITKEQAKVADLRSAKILKCLTKETQPARCLDIAAGRPGAQGGIGRDGRPGPQGLRGQTGQRGSQGPAGVAGKPGADGAPGTPGADGKDGVGYDCTGRPVPPGGTPATCPGEGQGPKGDKGDKGDTGATGPQGPPGETGATGPQGPAGPEGPAGAQGPQGVPGYVCNPAVIDTASGPVNVCAP